MENDLRRQSEIDAETLGRCVNYKVGVWCGGARKMVVYGGGGGQKGCQRGFSERKWYQFSCAGSKTIFAVRYQNALKIGEYYWSVLPVHILAARGL